MRIALLSPLFESVPPLLYGGTERVVANLARGLVEQGHDVTVYASGDSQVGGARLRPTLDKALRLSSFTRDEAIAAHVIQSQKVMRELEDFDVVHNHMDILGLDIDRPGVPFLTTLHGRLDEATTERNLMAYPGSPFVSISDSQRLPIPQLNWVGTIHHGLPLDDFEFQPKKGKYLAFLGRNLRSARTSPSRSPSARGFR